MSPVRRRRLRRLAAFAGGLVTVVLLWWVWHWQFDNALREARRHADTRLALYTSSLDGALERFTYLPDLLARQPLIRSALGRQPQDTLNAAMIRRINEHLARVAARSGAEAIYLMNARGLTVAASNAAGEDSFVGHRYDYRPYFRQAMQGGQGEFFAVGSTTGRPGYFVSAAVTAGDVSAPAAAGAASPPAASDAPPAGETRASSPLGVVAVKVSLESLQADWRQAGEKVLLSDAHGVVILSSRADWRYRYLGGMDAEALGEIRAQRQFNGTDLRPLGERLGDGSLLVDGNGVGERFFTAMAASGAGGLGWRMHYLVPVRPLYASARNAVLVAGALCLALLLLGLWLRERQQRLWLREREARLMRDANERLESRVEARTRELESAQAELVQAGKLAALGTMAAGIAHELNQPLAGIRTYAASGARLLERGRPDSAQDNFQRIQALSERLATLIRQLKLFARKGGAREPIDLRARLDFVLDLLDERIARQQVDLELALPEGARPIHVAGDTVRIEQLLTNLLRNALDALREVKAPRLTVSVAMSDTRVVLTVGDNGPGIDEAVIEQLFDPFFTTKEVGDGLGLGLFIAYGIVQDLDGRIRAENRTGAPGGAAFIVELPRALEARRRQPNQEDSLT
ncbi:ATP-binding protein [Modicisalibacter radicis]|uniref:ATP-binding protein n=1 Tax=Halomonas sp. EAR18 TaxID=2518972 RepID=UPI001FCF1E32|nr:ATP-binding protein [Halomonas sp. EAR18]